MTTPLDRISAFRQWRSEIVLTIASILGLGGFVHELFLTDNPSWLKILASSAAITGAFGALLNLGGREPK